MPINTQINALIEAGWRVLESDFSEAAFRNWRKEALNCLTLLSGEDHPYTDHFRRSMVKPDVRNVLSGVGVLTAAGLGGSAGKTREEGSVPVAPARSMNAHAVNATENVSTGYERNGESHE